MQRDAEKLAGKAAPPAQGLGETLKENAFHNTGTANIHVMEGKQNKKSCETVRLQGERGIRRKNIPSLTVRV